MDIIKEIEDRRSYRSFEQRHVEEEIIDLIIKAGILAPTGKNRQSTQFIYLKSEDARKEFLKLYEKITGRNNAYYNALDIILVLAKKEGDCYINDGSLALGNMMLEATHLNVGSCWIHHIREVFEKEEGQQLLKKWGIIEEDLAGIGSLIVGYPDSPFRDKVIKDGRVHKI